MTKPGWLSLLEKIHKWLKRCEQDDVLKQMLVGLWPLESKRAKSQHQSRPEDGQGAIVNNSDVTHLQPHKQVVHSSSIDDLKPLLTSFLLGADIAADIAARQKLLLPPEGDRTTNWSNAVPA